MSAARDEILRRVRVALADRPEQVPVARDYRGLAGAGDLDLFAERVADYRAEVHRTDDPAATIETILRDRGVTQLVVPPGFPDEWHPAAPLPRSGGRFLAAESTTAAGKAWLDEADTVLTSCAVAIAETGTIVLDHGPGMGPRALTLVPDHHVVVVRADQVVAGVPDAVAALDPTRPLTWISGPSATSDIELERVEGVHGPRVLDVVLVG